MLKQQMDMLYFRHSRRKLAKTLYTKTGLIKPAAYVDALRPTLYYPSHNLHIAFIPKSGCSSLRLLTSRFVANDTCISTTPPWPDQLSQGTISRNHMDILTAHSMHSISFVRNPYSRFVSFFKNRVKKQVTDAAFSGITSFEACVDKSIGMPNHQRDNHFACQWFMLTPGLTTFSFIGYLEHYAEHAHQCFLELGASELILDNINSIKKNSSGSYNWRDYYTQTLADQIYQSYLPDFLAFGYHKDSWKKDFEAPPMAPMRHYDPMQDAERFRGFFTIKPHSRTTSRIT